MKLGLVQTKQNGLYDFANKDLYLTYEQVMVLKAEMEEQTIQLIEEACQLNCDFIVTPEAVNFCGLERCIDCGYEDVVQTLEDSFFVRVSNLAKKYSTYIVLGAFNKREGQIYNSAIVYDREGKNCLCYDKVHLAGDENLSLKNGTAYQVLDTEFGKIGIVICWDMQFPESCRELTLLGADLIVCPTWGWEGIYAHARAYENGIYVAGAMGIPFIGDITGIRNPSEVISPEGVILAQGSRDKAEVVCCDLDIKDCEEFKAMRLGNRHPETYKLIAKH